MAGARGRAPPEVGRAEKVQAAAAKGPRRTKAEQRAESRIDRLSSGVCHSDDFPAVKKRIAKFMAAGFIALKA